MSPSYPFSDLDLARRLERAEAQSNARLVEAWARLDPAIGAEWIDVVSQRPITTARTAKR